jgi:folate-binding protein YgfZ
LYLRGVPRLNREVKPGDLINNTFFDELCVDYGKGCYPGQETVAKINTHRGAAYKPVLGVASEALSEVVVDGKKVGKVLLCKEIEGHFFHYISLLRNFRINNSRCGDFNIFYYPYIEVTAQALAQEFFDQGVDSFQQGQEELAVDRFKKAIEIDPDFEDAYESLGVVLGRRGEYALAIKLMEELKEINPKCLMAYTNLSLFHMKQGEIEKAEQYKAEATLLNFEILGDEAERKREEEQLRAKKLAERNRREQMFLQVLELDSSDAMANNGMGEILLEKSNFKIAVEYFQKALSTDAKYSVAYLGLAKCYLGLNLEVELEQILRQGLKVATKNGDLVPANEMQRMLTAL